MLPLLNALSTLLAVLFIAYVVFILIPFIRHKPTQPGVVEDFAWHYFIPCRDEEVVIAETISRARTDFPHAHVWVIDDDSDDDTSSIANRFADTDDHVHVVQRRRPQARTGKGDALNAAYAQLNAWLPTDADRSRIIVGVVDADGEMAPNALEIVSSATVFGDPRVGAAQTAVWMKNRGDKTPYPGRGRMVNRFGSYLLRMQDLEFRTVIAAMQSLRTKTGTVGLGGNGQFTRLSVLDAIAQQYGEPWHGALLEDYELGLHVLLAGYENRHVYETHVSQEALPDIRRLITQRTRWAQGNIQCVKYIGDIVRSPNFDAAGLIEICYYLVLPFLQVIGAASVVGLAAFRIVSGVSDPATLIGEPAAFAGLLALVVTFSIAPFAMWGPIYRKRCEPSAPFWTGVAWGFGSWLYVYYMYICIFRAFWRILTGKTGWAKTRRNAEAHVAGATAVEV
ncbi:Glycosyltransferase, catalytic subunit of cellulose synthase and poly-beta-1,6-N-acetylglucosamine synthase [Curtobacterium sp. UNCCL20]|uniref:glycosyltransferase family 2 protein n=1 Tax=Curtobacterium sp. UNCCL20 TaxID=1502773 RepID=UPI000886B46D|nr:glycosyltransferase family 2 protein [Curtobacterium sp. UNCCL20]SDQ24955.1 Glycosyltransferase, catalytic subunit of cellulose synthase and poly-beta-1,6-N-acetylglucosamine synthase [Curtobacterium sp. UNCCL20]